jgi:hypothetical protein
MALPFFATGRLAAARCRPLGSRRGRCADGAAEPGGGAETLGRHLYPAK